MCQAKVGGGVTSRKKGLEHLGHFERLHNGQSSKCGDGGSVAGLNSDSPRTARHCWDPDCLICFPGRTLSRLSLQVLGGKEKANWVIKMSQG